MYARHQGSQTAPVWKGNETHASVVCDATTPDGQPAYVRNVTPPAGAVGCLLGNAGSPTFYVGPASAAAANVGVRVQPAVGQFWLPLGETARAGAGPIARVGADGTTSVTVNIIWFY